MYLLDTMVLDWLATGSRQLGPKATRIVDNAVAASLHASVVSFWEIGLLLRRKRLMLSSAVTLMTFRDDVLNGGIIEQPMSGQVVLAADNLSGFHKDPGDRFIVATALVIGATLVTSDDKILRWKSPLRRHDARK